jgi:hypothetical protein
MLKGLRKWMAENDRESFDMTHQAEYNWKAYISSHPEADKVVGPGIWRASARFLNFLEPNWRKLALPGTYGKQRCDFVFERIDGTAVRVHPSEKKEAKLTFGKLAEWEFGTRASAPGSSQPGDPSYYHMSYSQGMSGARALAWCKDRQYMRRGTALDDEEDLLADGCSFPLLEFLSARPFGRAWIEEGIETASLLFRSPRTGVDPEPLLRITTKQGLRTVWWQADQAKGR